MNAQAQALGLDRTRYADASGVQAGTVSTAGDQVRLEMVALEVPAFRQIVAMPEVTLPVAGQQYHVDALLGRDGIVGVKTGHLTGGRVLRGRRARAGGDKPSPWSGPCSTKWPPEHTEHHRGRLPRLLASMRHVLGTVPVVRRGAALDMGKGAVGRSSHRPRRRVRIGSRLARLAYPHHDRDGVPLGRPARGRAGRRDRFRSGRRAARPGPPRHLAHPPKAVPRLASHSPVATVVETDATRAGCIQDTRTRLRRL